MAENTPPVIDTPLLGNTVNPLNLENSEYKLPELPSATTYKGPSSTVTPADIKNDQPQRTVFGDRVNSLIKKLDDAPKWAGDLTPYGKIVGYDADYTGANFQRYYTHPKFQKLGFSPYRDNETLYNQNGSWVDDASRMMRGWSSLFATGAYDGVKSWADNPFNFEEDTDTAEDMSRKMSEMTSSRGGFGGGVINFGANTAYSMGLVTEFMAETAVISAATAVTGGADIGVTAPLEAARAASLANKLGRAAQFMSATYRTLSSLKDLNTARNFFRSVNAGETLVKAFNFVNPLENTVSFLKDTNKALKSGEQVYNLAKASKGLGAFIKDVRQTQLVMSEANLEGGMVQNDMVQKLTDDFYKENGRMPNTSEATDIYQSASIAGNKTIAWNIPALYLSNKIVFETAFKGFKPMRILAAEASEGLAGRLTFNQAWRTAGVNPWSVVKQGWQQSLKNLTKASTWAPKNILSKGLSYTSRNITEALQEQYQEGVSLTMKQYYENIYRDPSKAGSDEMGSILSDNMLKQFTTAEGFETFASGFFMGGVLQGPQKLIFQAIPKKIFQMRNPAEYAERQKQKEEWTNKVVESLNEVTKDPARYFSNISEDMVIQRQAGNSLNEANENNDEKSFRDIADDAIFNHLHTVINSGRFDLITGHLKDMKQLSPDELQNAFGPVPENQDDDTYYTNRIDSLLKKAEYIKKRNDAVNEQFVNPFNPFRFNKDTDSQNYIDEAIRWRAYEDAKKKAIFSDYAFDRTLDRMQDIITDVSNDKPVSKANSTDFSLLFNDKSIDAEINSLSIEIDAFSQGNATQKQQARQSQKKKEALEELKENISYYRTGLRSKDDIAKSATRNASTTIKKGTRVKINTKNGGTGVVTRVIGKYAILEDGKRVNRKYLEPIDKTNVVEGNHLDESLDLLHKSYTDYLRVIANINGDHVFDNKVNDSFSKLKDFFALENDSDNLADTINFLHNPATFIEYSQRMEDIRRSLYDQRSEYMKQALDEYMKIKDQNELLNKLLEEGVYIHPDDIAPLVNDKIIPSKLFDVVNYEELDSASDKYQKALQSINQWLEVTATPTQDVDVLSDRISSVRDQLGNEGNKKLFDEFLNILNTARLNLNQEQIDVLLKGLSQDMIAIVGGTTDTLRNQEERGDMDTAWLTSPESLNGQEKQEYYTALDKLTSQLSTTSYRQQPMIEDDKIEADKYNKSAGTKSSPIFIGDIVREVIAGNYNTDNNLQDKTSSEIPETVLVNSEQVKITGMTPISQMPEELLTDLIESYKAENRSRIANGEDILDPFGPEASNEVILDLPGFKSYIKVFSKPRVIMNSYNTRTGRTIDASKPVEKPSQESAPIIKTFNMRRQLDLLGYTKQDIDSMGANEANRIIKEKISKPVEVIEDNVVIDNTEVINALKSIEDMFNNATTIQAVENAEEEVLAMLADPEQRRKINLTNEFISNLVEGKKRELMSNFTYDSINTGDVIILNDQDNTKMLVVEKTANEIKLRKFGDTSDNYMTIKKDVVPGTVKYKYIEGMENIITTSPVTTEEKEISDESVKSYTEFNEDDDSDMVDEDMKKASSMSSEERDNDLTNNLGCK